MFTTIFTRNIGYALVHPIRTWSVRSACKTHVSKHPTCAWCGGLNGVDAHHIVPLWADPSRGSDPDNFISLCHTRRCHLVVGHNCNYATKYVRNVRDVCAGRLVEHRPITGGQ